jgi:hypothetical protein
MIFFHDNSNVCELKHKDLRVFENRVLRIFEPRRLKKKAR